MNNILCLGDFSSGKSSFLNMLLGVSILPEQLQSTNLPVIQIHSGETAGIYVREKGQKYGRPIAAWSKIPPDWSTFEYIELTVPNHPLLDKGLVIWDSPGVNSTNEQHIKHLEVFLQNYKDQFQSVFYFLHGNLQNTHIEFIKQWPFLLNKLSIVVNIKEVRPETESRKIENQVKKDVRVQLGAIPVELLYIGDLYEDFASESDKKTQGYGDQQRLALWQNIAIDFEGLKKKHEKTIIGDVIFDILKESTFDKRISQNDIMNVILSNIGKEINYCKKLEPDIRITHQYEKNNDISFDELDFLIALIYFEIEFLVEIPDELLENNRLITFRELAEKISKLPKIEENKIAEHRSIKKKILSDISKKLNSKNTFTGIEWKFVQGYYGGNYYISATQITFNQFYEFCDKTGYKKPDSLFGRGNQPVINVNIEDAVAFCTWLSKEIGATIRLPEKNEWEFAAKGGKSNKPYIYSGSDFIDEVAWNVRNSGGTPHDVGTKRPNDLGIYDMSGNVWEWCGLSGIIRGGSYSDLSRCRVSELSVLPPNSKDTNT